MNDFYKLLEENRELVWSEILRYLRDPTYPDAYKIPLKYIEDVNFHWQVIREYPERKGKYLRPTLLLLTAESMGIQKEKAIKTAAAMQVSEEWLLVHDDLEDNSLLRRGKPTLHKLYGDGLAVNAGDTLQVIMWKILFDNQKELGNSKTWALLEEFYEMLMRTALGQSVELKWVMENRVEFTDEDWFFIADGKTSFYTISTPMRQGAIIASATNKQLDLLAEFGTHLGRSFQIVDDVLDLTSDFGGLKKQTGNDIYEGKRTVILGHLLRSISESEKIKLTSVINSKRDQKTDKDVKWVISKMREYGSIDYAINLARIEGNKARIIFRNKLQFLSDDKARKKIELFIDFVLERVY